jgi:GMP synthase (glutamine-hydrolysing)
MGISNVKSTKVMILLIDCGYSAIDSLKELIDQYIDVHRISIYDVDLAEIKELSPAGIVISSAQLSVHEIDTISYQDQIKKLLELELPILGIGIGHHLIGLCFGAQTAYEPYKNESIEIGILGDDPLFDKLPIDLELIEDHAGTISIPPGFELLASSDVSINEAMKKKDNPIYGVQFIPELSGNYGAIIMDNFVNISIQKNAH